MPDTQPETTSAKKESRAFAVVKSAAAGFIAVGVFAGLTTSEIHDILGHKMSGRAMAALLGLMIAGGAFMGYVENEQYDKPPLTPEKAAELNSRWTTKAGITERASVGMNEPALPTVRTR